MSPQAIMLHNAFILGSVVRALVARALPAIGTASSIFMPVVAVVIVPIVAVVIVPVVAVVIVPFLVVLATSVLPVVAIPVFRIAVPAPAILVLPLVAFPVVSGAIEPRLVFRRSDEVYGPIAGIVLTAMLAPVPRVTRRHVQVNWRRRLRLGLDQHRLHIHEGRGMVIAKPNLSVDTRRHFARQNDVEAQVTRAAGADAQE